MAFVINRIKGSESEGGRVRSAMFDLGVSNVGVAPTTYLTTGLALTPKDFGFSVVLAVEFLGQSAAVAGVPAGTAITTLYVPSYNRQTSKFQLFVEEAVAAGGPLLELANATVIDTTAFQVRVTGI